MKILLVNKFHYMKGGSERYYFTLAEAFKNAGHDVVFFAMKDEKNIPCEQEKYFVSNASKAGGIKSKINMVLHIVYSKEAYKKMTLLLKEERPDLVILNLVHKQITCSVIDAIKDYNPDIKIVWTMHDLICVCPSYTMLDGKGKICEKCLDGNFKHCFKNRCAHGSKFMSYLSTYEAERIRKHDWYDKVDLFVCPSNFYKEKLEQARFTKSRIVYIPNPLSEKITFEISEHSKDYILYFGRLSKEKGIATLIRAMKNVDHPLIILGTGPIEKECESMIANEHLNNKVKMLGFKTGRELDDYVKNSKAVILPSEWYENGPYAAMEAMAKGRPLIVSNLGGLPELVDNGKNGYIFEANNVESLAYYIEKLYELDQKEYNSFEKYSLEKAKKMFDSKTYIDRLMDISRKE